jgi:hypothetical protein
MKYTNAGAMHHHQQQMSQPSHLQQQQQNIPPQQYQNSGYMSQPVHPMQQQQGHMNPMYSTNGYPDDLQSQSMDMSGGLMGSDYSSGLGGDMMTASSTINNANLARLPEQARSELTAFEARISYANNLEASTDGLSYVLVCTLSKSSICSKKNGKMILEREQVPNLRLVIPRAYPQHPASVERAALDLGESFWEGSN